jgi:hypothetical protein
LLTRQRVVGYSRMILFAIILALIFWSYTGDIDTRFFRQGDFIAFYTAGVIVQDGCGNSFNLYDVEKQRIIQNEYGIIEPHEMPTVFLNPPLYAWLMVPFSKMPYSIALNIWRLFIIVIALLSTIIITKNLRLDLKWWDSLTILLVSLPGFAVVINGQNTLFFLGLYAIAYMLFTKQHDFTAGVILGFGALKPQLFLFLPVVLIFQKKWNALIGLSSGFLLIISVSVLLVGQEGIVEYLKVFTSNVYLDGIQVQVHKMHSFPAFIRLILGLETNPVYLTFFTILSLTVLFGYLSLIKSLQLESSSLLSLSILGTLIATPHLFHYDLTLLLLPFLVIYSWTKDKKQSYIMSRNSRIALLALFIYLWLGFFIIEIVGVQFSVLLIIYLFVTNLKNGFQLETGVNHNKV